MANPEHLAILRQGVKTWNEWWNGEYERLRADFREADLSNANLAGVDLLRADLRKANLSGANLTGARLHRAILNGANLSGAALDGSRLSVARLGGTNLAGASLENANLLRADLSRANLSGANLTGALLNWADLTGAILEDTEFSRARALATVFADVNLASAKNLTDVQHFAPSTIGIDTIYKSKGKIPEVFLRGCGVPDEMIGYIKSIGGAIQYHSCFISYSTKDQAFADGLYADLQAKGVRCWFAPHDIKGGRKIHEQLDEAIQLHDKLLLILSEHSMASQWVKTELGKALKREKQESKRMLFPVRLVSFEAMEQWEYMDSSGTNLAEEIRQYFIPDFSNWKNHDSYQQALERLVSDLKAG